MRDGKWNRCVGRHLLKYVLLQAMATEKYEYGVVGTE